MPWAGMQNKGEASTTSTLKTSSSGSNLSRSILSAKGPSGSMSEMHSVKRPRKGVSNVGLRVFRVFMAKACKTGLCKV